MTDSMIKCMQHCSKDINIFFINFPPLCPICQADLTSGQLRIPPFVIPCPFKNAIDCPCSVVMKPTTGDFLRDYKNDKDLHIGVTDSKGRVYEYDERGLSTGASNWTECIAINMEIDEQEHHHWDQKLCGFCNKLCWSRERYSGDSHSCFNFVLGYLKTVCLKNFNFSSMDKVWFSRNFLLPKTVKVAKYISLYRKIREEGTVCQNNNETQD